MTSWFVSIPNQRSGFYYHGAIMQQEKLGPDAVVVTILPDDNKKYLSTDLLKEEEVKEEFLSPDIELHNALTNN